MHLFLLFTTLLGLLDAAQAHSHHHLPFLPPLFPFFPVPGHKPTTKLTTAPVTITGTTSGTTRATTTGTTKTTSSTTLATTTRTTSPTTRITTSGTTTKSTSPTTFSTTKGTTKTTSSTTTASPTSTPYSGNVQSTILVIARDSASASSASSGLNGYGIPFQVLLVPSTGAVLPALNSSTGGNFGGIIVVSQLSYDYGTTGYQSAFSAAQWDQLYTYQLAYGVRMVQIDVYPGSLFGANTSGGCCGANVEQLMSFSNTTAFAQAGIKEGATVSTANLYHYPATITNSTTTTEIARFAAGNGFSESTAAVINDFDGRQQMAFFISWATDWSPTSNFLQHAYIAWMTRGLYAGYRRVNYNTQIDDMFLETDLYTPTNGTYRVTPTDMKAIVSWLPTIRAKLNTGSVYYPEIGHNGNGNIIEAQAKDYDTCAPNAIDTGDRPETALEFQKPLGTGVNSWPTTPATYSYSSRCINLDPLRVWFANTANRDVFMHISHTYTHLNLNNVTYSDALKEIQFNQAWFQQTGIAAGRFTANGLIPPAITGLHNGDALRAWADAGLTHCVGDNSRPVLRDPTNPMYALVTNVSSNGYSGINVIPRWATRIYYNCDTPDCTLLEWINTSAGTGDFQNLLNQEKADTTRRLFGLYHDGYMFHQANLRTSGIAPITINGVTANISIFQAWVETTVQEFVRLVNWPLVTLQQSDLAKAFIARRARDACGYKLSWTTANNKITAVTVTANGNTCSAPIPLTVPGSVTNTLGFTTEKIGNDPLTIWVQLSGAPQTFTLSTPIAV